MLARFCLALSLAAAISGAAFAETLFVYSGAGLRPAVQPLAERFEAATGHEVVLEYGGTGQILARFQTTGRGDVFLAGTRFFSDKLEAAHQIEGVTALGAHGAAIGVSRAQVGTIRGVGDLARPGLRLALGDPQAMALGRTADEIMQTCGDPQAIRANTLVRATTLQQLALYVAEGNVDAAILSVSAALPHSGKIEIVAIPADCYAAEQITGGVLSTARHPGIAADFVAFLASEEGRAAFAAVGFGPAGE
ncbi:molybdate ABC transporter substrate-binding protein [Rhodovulum adriaticum]|uniref:Molybdate transport system substrate-binding protein n=1 Tax=Rhodovulum adriaticum TaxID=35804 RepID=A0A4R2NNC2_RHOAD|nr:molybdate ABC transporter substrate-binding protein [Rhodovulum adriaticum]MBK1634389.1 molybdate ABC transporter substrate-binding protein [Rhodovulum adriaticum]TCP23243.1 molybdate transport system substrate-binding protein [Rhodovulum adriaticum]